MSKTTNDNFVEPLLSKAKLEELQEEYSIILCEIIEYITKNLGQSIKQQTIPFDYFNHWRKYSTKISIPKETAIEFGYGNNKFIEVRGTVNRKFYIHEEYEAEKDGVEQIIFLIEPELILKSDKPSQNGKITRYHEVISEEVKKFLTNLSKDAYESLHEQLCIDGVIEVPITLPEGIHPLTLYKYFKRYKDKALFRNVAGFRRPHANSEARKQGYNLYVKVTGLDF